MRVVSFMRSCGWQVNNVVKYCQRLLFAVLLLFLLFANRTGSGIAQTLSVTVRQIDSLRGRADSAADCGERVQAREKLCNWFYKENDTLQLLASLRSFENEAQQCGDDENRLYARMWRLACYYNYSMRDSFFTASNDALRLFTQRGHERYRYEVFRLRVQYYLFCNEFHHALQEAERVVRMAQEEGSAYGLGISHFCLAFVFQLQYVYDMALTHYSEALVYLKQNEPQHVELRLHCYDQMADCYASAGAYDQLDSVNDLWSLEFKMHRIDMHDTSERNSWQLIIERYYLSQARYWMAKEDLSRAWDYLDSASRFVQGVVGGEMSFFIEKETWFQKAGFLDSAFAVNDKLLAMNSDGDVARSRLDHLQVRAQLLLAMGNYDEAARLYDSLLTERNKIFKASTVQATMELSAILEAERVQRATLKSRLYMLIAGIVVFFSVTLSIVLWRKNRLTLRKNKMLVEKVERLAISHDAIQELQRLQGLQQAESKERELYERLEAMMRERHPYLDAKLNRESLARELGTNSTYLANAIKACRPGVTVGKYIMEWRVAYAVNLLRTCRLQMGEIAVKSGFVTRATMNRAFNECYGMSPTEYRGAIQSSKEIDVEIEEPIFS